MFGIGSHMPIRHTYWYSVHEVGPDATRFQLPGITRRLDDVAVDAAEDYHSNHDGWESSWPLDITLYETKDGPAIATFEVERETVPEFHAKQIEKKSESA